MNLSRVAAVLVCALSALVGVSFADDVTDAIDEAVSSYKSGDFTNAAAQLDYAAALVRQQKAAGVVNVFCEPKSGWKASEAESSAAGSMMGVGISAERTYYKGDAEVQVSLVVDSPMLQSVMMMLSNPAMLTMSGGKLIKVQGNKGMLQKEDDRVSVNFVVNGTALVTLEGWGGATEADVLGYGECLNLGALE